MRNIGFLSSEKVSFFSLFWSYNQDKVPRHRDPLMPVQFSATKSTLFSLSIAPFLPQAEILDAASGTKVSVDKAWRRSHKHAHACFQTYHHISKYQFWPFYRLNSSSFHNTFSRFLEIEEPLLKDVFTEPKSPIQWNSQHWLHREHPQSIPRDGRIKPSKWPNPNRQNRVSREMPWVQRNQRQEAQTKLWRLPRRRKPGRSSNFDSTIDGRDATTSWVGFQDRWPVDRSQSAAGTTSSGCFTSKRNIFRFGKYWHEWYWRAWTQCTAPTQLRQHR